MSTTTVKLSVVGALVVASLAVPTWQQLRFQRAQSANGQLRAQEAEQRAQAAELGALRAQAQRLHKLADDQAELEQLRQWKMQTESELSRLHDMAGTARRANLEVAQLRAQLARDASDAGTNSLTATLRKGEAQRVEGDLAGLTARLHLTPEQTEAVRDILWRHARVITAETEHLYAGKYDKDELDRMKEEVGSRDEQIQALLTPEQKADWPAYKQDLAARNARLAASIKMTGFLSALDLTSEQADQAFAAVYQFQLDRCTGKATSGTTDELEDVTWQLHQETKALEPILTPSQLESLRQFQDSRARIARDLYSLIQGSSGSK